jgi:hypothetical protein
MHQVREGDARVSVQTEQGQAFLRFVRMDGCVILALEDLQRAAERKTLIDQECIFYPLECIQVDLHHLVSK